MCKILKKMDIYVPSCVAETSSINENKGNVQHNINKVSPASLADLEALTWRESYYQNLVLCWYGAYWSSNQVKTAQSGRSRGVIRALQVNLVMTHHKATFLPLSPVFPVFYPLVEWVCCPHTWITQTARHGPVFSPTVFMPRKRPFP